MVALLWSNFFPDNYVQFDHDPLVGTLTFHFRDPVAVAVALNS